MSVSYVHSVPTPLGKKKPTWHLGNKLLKCEIRRQGKLSQRIRNGFNGKKIDCCIICADCWEREGERSPAAGGLTARTVWREVRKARFRSRQFDVC